MNRGDQHQPAPLVKTAGFPSGHAIVVAVANYEDINALPEAVLNDARDVASVLISPAHCGYNPKNVRVLLDKEATLANFREALEAVAQSSQPGDTVVIFFSGHGALLGDPADPASALLPIDCRFDDLSGTSLSEVEFSVALRHIKAQRLVVLIDACHSGGAGSFKGAMTRDLPPLGFSEKALGRLAQGTGRVLIASSRPSETSLVFPRARNSVFTEHLVEALRGHARTLGDGLIRVFEVFNYVSEKVRNAAPGRQHPIFKASDLEDNFPVALDRGGVKQASPGASSEAGATPWRQLEEILADLYPAGPVDQEIWARAGGDLSRLRLNSTGRANWFAALRTLRQGGGGSAIRKESLIKTALDDFPHHPELDAILADES
jgi:hypothetical protein